jgi:hypothetical protein
MTCKKSILRKQETQLMKTFLKGSKTLSTVLRQEMSFRFSCQEIERVLTKTCPHMSNN